MGTFMKIQYVIAIHHKVYSNNILNFQESTRILNAYTKTVWKPIECTTYIYNIYIYIYIYIYLNTQRERERERERI